MADSVNDYIERLLGYIRGKDFLAVLRDTPRILAESIHGHSAESLSKRPAPGKWSIAEILAHLSETEMAASWRYRQMLEHSGSAVIPYEQDLWAEWSEYATCDPKESLELFRLLRERNLKLLSRLSPEQWEKFGVHGERGKETVRRLAEMAAGHDINHLQQVEKILG